jgi:hypothetical protein
MSHLNLVEFPVQVSLADIPGRLRKLADEMEMAENDDRPITLVFVEGYEDGYVKVGCFGECPSKWEVVGLLNLAAQRFTPEEGDVSRKGGD